MSIELIKTLSFSPWRDVPRNIARAQGECKHIKLTLLDGSALESQLPGIAIPWAANPHSMVWCMVPGKAQPSMTEPRNGSMVLATQSRMWQGSYQRSMAGKYSLSRSW
jgi:hypothetical protein